MHNNGDLTVAVNGTHLKGWDGREVFELISILLKDKKKKKKKIIKK